MKVGISIVGKSLIAAIICLLTTGSILRGEDGGEAGVVDTLRGGEMVFVEDFGFHIDKHEVTNAEYAEFLSERGNQKEGGAMWVELGSKYALIEETEERFVAKEGFALHPAVEVSFYGGRAYWKWAGKRLPAEAEWRQACAGKEGSKYPWGDLFEPNKANIFGDKDGYLRTAPVGSFPEGASPYGALDMGGNVWEWSASAEGKPPFLHGGSWVNGNTLTRCANRASTIDSHSYIKGNTMGFRCAK